MTGMHLRRLATKSGVRTPKQARSCVIQFGGGEHRHDQTRTGWGFQGVVHLIQRALQRQGSLTPETFLLPLPQPGRSFWLLVCVVWLDVDAGQAID